MIEKITQSATSVTLAVFISRILGLVREQVLAYFFGASQSMDAFVVGYRIPNLLRDLFAEGALAGAFVKVFSFNLEKRGLKDSFQIAQVLISNFLIILLGIVILGILLAPYLVSLIAPEFKGNPYKFQLTVYLTQLMMPFLLFISLASILAGMLNSLKIFFLPALSSGFFNLSSILIGVIGYYLLVHLSLEPIYAIALGVTLGGFWQFIFQYPVAKKQGFSFKFCPNFRDSHFVEVLKLIFPVILGFSLVQINIFINTFFATSCGEGAVSWYSYAFRVMYVPLGLFGIGISQALLPELSKQIARKDLNLAKKTFSSALIVSLSVSLPSAIGLYLLSHPIISFLFERGKFTSLDTFQTSQILQILSLGLPFYGLSKTAIPLFYSLGLTIIPPLGSMLGVVTNVATIILTIEKMGIKAVALGTTLSLLLQSLFLVLMSFIKLRVTEFKFLIQSGFTLLVAGFFLILVIKLFQNFFIIKNLGLLAVILIAGLCFIWICKILGPKECYLFYEKFLRLFKL
ncbi:MAG: murein biosynthesis integral membrane protein MurJ [Thermodesulfobacteriaceae bacterium]|nr:murein biosynthesis integral membrane protein MurJ [Thermodesulfobacteriaceae bacterium]MDW8136406.1 murein biosynthesis integral membrane protein MurJ [Thermodesulfobacterium sp.]